MKKILLSTLLFTLLFSCISTSSFACDKVIKKPKSSKDNSHHKK